MNAGRRGERGQRELIAPRWVTELLARVIAPHRANVHPSEVPLRSGEWLDRYHHTVSAGERVRTPSSPEARRGRRVRSPEAGLGEELFQDRREASRGVGENGDDLTAGL